MQQPHGLKDWLPCFLSEFQRGWLKEKEFRKNRQTFSRDRGPYWERFHFQASSQNNRSVSRWRFYVNVGIEFKDLPKQLRWSLFPNTHWSSRINHLVPEAPYHWEYDLQTDRQLLALSLIVLVESASVVMAKEIHEIRRQLVAR
jgi:uncharacterized protein (DUF2461 family)